MILEEQLLNNNNNTEIMYKAAANHATEKYARRLLVSRKLQYSGDLSVYLLKDESISRIERLLNEHRNVMSAMQLGFLLYYQNTLHRQDIDFSELLDPLGVPGWEVRGQRSFLQYHVRLDYNYLNGISYENLVLMRAALDVAYDKRYINKNGGHNITERPRALCCNSLI